MLKFRLSAADVEKLLNGIPTPPAPVLQLSHEPVADAAPYVDLQNEDSKTFPAVIGCTCRSVELVGVGNVFARFSPVRTPTKPEWAGTAQPEAQP